LNYKIDYRIFKDKRNLIIILHCLKMQDGNMFMAPKTVETNIFADE